VCRNPATGARSSARDAGRNWNEPLARSSISTSDNSVGTPARLTSHIAVLLCRVRIIVRTSPADQAQVGVVDQPCRLHRSDRVSRARASEIVGFAVYNRIAH
jgi:hypothetical protein